MLLIGGGPKGRMRVRRGKQPSLVPGTGAALLGRPFEAALDVTDIKQTPLLTLTRPSAALGYP
jgi:hypothetical protein